MAERQPGSPEPADDPRPAHQMTDRPSGRVPALADTWAASPDGVVGGLRGGSERETEAEAEAATDGEVGTAAAEIGTPARAERTRAEARATKADTRTERAETAATERGDEDEDRGGILSFFRELPVLIVLAFALALLLKTFVVQAFYIPSGSMEPTLMPGDRVLVEKVLYHPSRGDIIVFEDPHPGAQPDRGPVDGFLHWLSQGLGFSQPADEDFIKRVIGLPGDIVELRQGKLFVNGERVAQPYLHGQPDRRDYGPETVPRGSLFVLGDNRLNSNDSRFGLGFVPEDRVIGRAFVLIWPPSRIGWLH